MEGCRDGSCSGDENATFVEGKYKGFIQAWRERIEPASSEVFVSGEGDVWEVDSVSFGEGCSTHADQWNNTEIERWVN